MRSPDAAFDLRAAISNEVRAAIAACADEDMRAADVHACRVRLKRARALARIGAENAPGLADVFHDAARAVMRSLAPSRELAALSEVARKAARKEKRKAGAALDAAADRFETMLATLHRPDRNALRTGLNDLLALAQVWPEATPRQIARGANRLRRRARRARRSAVASGDLALRHRWRKREKDRLYAAEILGPAWPARRLRRSARELTDVLGRERDTSLLLERLRREPNQCAQADLRGAESALKSRLKRLRRRAAALARELRGKRC